MEKNKEVRIDVLITDDLRKKVKKYCIDNDTNMSKLIREFLESKIKNNK